MPMSRQLWEWRSWRRRRWSIDRKRSRNRATSFAFRQGFRELADAVRIGRIVRRGDGGEAFERIDHRLVGDDAAAEVLAEHGFETHRIDLIRAGDDAVALQRGEGVIDHTGIIVTRS
jgi:hypothetical protein